MSEPQTLARRTRSTTAPGSGSGTSNDFSWTCSGPVRATMLPVVIEMSFASTVRRLDRAVLIKGRVDRRDVYEIATVCRRTTRCPVVSQSGTTPDPPRAPTCGHPTHPAARTEGRTRHVPGIRTADVGTGLPLAHGGRHHADVRPERDAHHPDAVLPDRA